MKKIPIWIIQENVNSRKVTVAYSDSEANAIQLAKSIKNNRTITKSFALKIKNQVWLLANETPIQLNVVDSAEEILYREKILSTLTDEQKRVVNFTYLQKY